ncbi:MAG: DsrE family protein [Syntrophales bacterium]|nr:DsrE family protein [Syntrophales bacterium]MDD5642259.1 DsrE family protein [Syntrophales bacterium]
MKLLFIISKGLEKAGSAIRAMQFAALAAQQGNPVEVFLIDEAVHWAQGMRAAHGEGLTDYTALLSTPESPVRVCQPCAEKRLISQDKLIAGAVIAPVPMLVEKMASPEYKVFTF